MNSALRTARVFTALAVVSLCSVTMLVGCTGDDTISSTTNTGTPPAAGSAVINATFANASGTNANTSGFQSASAQALTSTGQSGLTLLNVSGSNVAGTTARTFALSLAENGPIQAGKTYVFGGSSASTLTYTQAGQSGAQGWAASGGSAIVDTITGKNYKIRIVNAAFTAGGDNQTGATGSFTVNGTVDATVQ